jgi:WD40 repeat protein
MTVYQVGGSLASNAPSYVERHADTYLYEGLKQGQFCYVFNSRQMGKSSLLVRTYHRLQESGFRCSTIDMTRLGNENITPSQWYKGIAAELWRGFDLLGTINLKTWWQQLEDMSLVHRLSAFVEEILQQYPQENICIFIDEIDSILSLPFSIDDFFAFIRFCYNQRANSAEYQRLTFALFGVATPSDLIQDKQRTPFNIGTAIELGGFHLDEAQPLCCGFLETAERPQVVLQEILHWTGGQPFLTQKLCYLVLQALQASPSQESYITKNRESFWVGLVARTKIIHRWESQDEPEHLRTIRDRLLYNEKYAARLLGIYQRILQGETVVADDSQEQTELMLSGLVVRDGGILQVKNRIYAEVFNVDWVKQQLSQLRPYSQALKAWVASNFTDTSRLLQGKALRDAQRWAHGKSLSDLDYQFLAASQQHDRATVQQALEAARAQEVEARLTQEKRSARLQRLLLIAVSFALVISSSLGAFAFHMYRNARQETRRAKINEIKAIATSAESLFASQYNLQALKEAIKATRRVRQMDNIEKFNPELQRQVRQVLRKTAYQVRAYNTLTGHDGTVYEVLFSPDGDAIASASWDGTIKLWKPDGTLITTLRGHKKGIFGIAFSRDGRYLASASDDNTVKLWKMNRSDGDIQSATLVRTFRGHEDSVHEVAFSPDGKNIVSGSNDHTIKIWKRDGKLIKTIPAHEKSIFGLDFHPNGKIFASGSWDNTIKIWRRDGTLLQTIDQHQTDVNEIAFHPSGKFLASASDDKTIKFWTLNGREIATLRGHQNDVNRLAFDKQGQILASSSDDGTVKIWDLTKIQNFDRFPYKDNWDITPVNTFRGPKSAVWGIDISPNNRLIVSTGADFTVNLWRREENLLTRLSEHQDQVTAVALSSVRSNLIVTGTQNGVIKFWHRDGKLLRTIDAHEELILGITFGPDGQSLASTSWDGTATLWNLDGSKQLTLKDHDGGINQLSFSTDGKLMATGSDDDTIKLWRRDGTLLKTLTRHEEDVNSVVFSPDGEFIASASRDRTIKLWTRKGEFLRTLGTHEDTIYAVAFGPDGELLASAGRDRVVKIWKPNGKLVATLKGHTDRVRDVAFTPDGRFIISASWDNSLRIWRRNGSFVTALRGHRDGVSQLAISQDGKTLVSAGGGDQVAIVWQLDRVLDFDRLLNYSCDWIRNYLKTNAEVPESDRNLCEGLGAHPTSDT